MFEMIIGTRISNYINAAICKNVIVFMLLVPCCYAVGQSGQIDGFEIPRLSPRPQKVEGVNNAVVSLNGSWNFQVIGKNIIKPVNVPGEWEMQGCKVNEGETALYTRDIEIPADWKNKRIKIRFDGVSSHALVKLNGQKIGEHEGSFVPFELDITPTVKEGKNELQVEVQALTISDLLACTSQYAAHTVGGILRKATMFVLPEINIASSVVTTVFDAQYRNATLQVQSQIAMEHAVPGVVQLKYELTDAAGKLVVSKTAGVQNASGLKNINDIQTAIAVKQPKQWNPEHPYLYLLKVSLLANGKIKQIIEQPVGFRQVIVQGNQLFVNGKPVKLHGVNRHSVYPLTGRSISIEFDRKDAELFRAANCNYIRTSHYPPSEEFLNAADELGLFVESEASLTWIQHQASLIWKKWNYTDEKFLPYMMRANIENILAGRNHPSVIIWSLGNESRWSPLWAKVNAVVKQFETTRPTTFHDQCWGGFNNAGSKADIAVYHYPGTNGGKASDTMRRPVLFGEYAHISCYSRRELATDPGVREAYGAPLAQMYDSMYHHSGCLGGAIWSGIDDVFHMPDGRIIGYGPWGVIDAWRRPKPEYYGVKKAYAPVVITHIGYPTANNNLLSLAVENRYDFTKLQEVKIEYSIDGIKHVINNLNITPHDSGTINIPVDVNAKEVDIAFIDPRGFEANEEKITLRHDIIAPTRQLPLSFTENDAAITVKQGDIEYLISKRTGIIQSAKKGDKEILSKGPVFGVVPMNYDDGGKPNIAGETYQNNIYPLKNYSLYTLFANDLVTQSTDSSIDVSMNVLFYDASAAKQSYIFAKNGTVAITYEVQYKGDDTLPRQYGMMMQFPKTFDKLTWERKGDFSTYPENDISRTAGAVMMQAVHLASVEAWHVVPVGDWKDDANELGSNDFRSTKKHIYSASLTDKDNNGIGVISDATQSTRSWLQDEKIQLLVADYSNKGSEPYYTSPHSIGQINIKNKTLKGKFLFRVY